MFSPRNQYTLSAAAQQVDNSSRSVPSDIVCERGSITAMISSAAKRLRKPCNVVRIAVGWCAKSS